MGEERVTNSIRRLRFDHGELTQQQLAERVGGRPQPYRD